MIGSNAIEIAQQHGVQLELRARQETANDEIGVSVSRKQRCLEEDETRGPDGGGSSEPRAGFPLRPTGCTRNSRKALTKMVAA
jgi:hypothetical protein